MKDKIKKFFQALGIAIKTTLIIWTDKQMIKHLEKKGYFIERE